MSGRFSRQRFSRMPSVATSSRWPPARRPAPPISSRSWRTCASGGSYRRRSSTARRRSFSATRKRSARWARRTRNRRLSAECRPSQSAQPPGTSGCVTANWITGVARPGPGVKSARGVVDERSHLPTKRRTADRRTGPAHAAGPVRRSAVLRLVGRWLRSSTTPRADLTPGPGRATPVIQLAVTQPLVPGGWALCDGRHSADNRRFRVRRAHRADRLRVAEKLRLLAVELLRRYDPPLAQVRQLRELIGGAGRRAGGHLLDVATEGILLNLCLLNRPLMHLPAADYQVDQDTEDRKDQHEQHPQRLAATRQVPAAEDVHIDCDHQPDPEDEEEDLQDRPERVEEGVIRCEIHGLAPWTRRQQADRR